MHNNTTFEADTNTNPTTRKMYIDVTCVLFQCCYSMLQLDSAIASYTFFVHVSSRDFWGLKSVTLLVVRSTDELVRPWFSVQRRDGACPNRQIFAQMFP